MNSWLHLAQGLLLGCILGVVFGFLRPLRPRWLGDLLFLAAFFHVWIFLGFALCGGDLRMAYSLTLPAGILLWECSFGKFLQPLCYGFWQFLTRFLGRILHLGKNTF